MSLKKKIKNEIKYSKHFWMNKKFLRTYLGNLGLVEAGALTMLFTKIKLTTCNSGCGETVVLYGLNNRVINGITFDVSYIGIILGNAFLMLAYTTILLSIKKKKKKEVKK